MHRRFLVALSVALLSLGALAPNVAAAPYPCQCVDYVKQVFGISASTALGNAKDAGSALTRLGWTRYTPSYTGTRPRANLDIVILQPRILAADATNGHIGVVGSWSLNSYGDMTVTMRSANWRAPTFTDRNCNNVSNVRLPASGMFKANMAGVAFYRK